MALKSLQNRFTSSNKNYENDLHENHSRRLHNPQELRRRSSSFKKRNSRRSLKYLPNASYRSSYRGRIAGTLPLVPSVLTIPAMSSYYRGHHYRYPVTISDWNIAARIRLQNSWYEYRSPYQPIPVPSILSPRMLPVCPYPSGFAYPLPAFTPMLPSPVLVDELSTVPYYQNVYSPEQTVPNEIYEPYWKFESVDDPPFYEVIDSSSRSPVDHSMEFYLSLPKDLFPNAMMLSLDPNPIIDEFCKYNDVLDHAPWIMDLEFGVPKEATTRPIAMYDVKYNSIQCKNTPNAIHPGFEKCDPEFKSVLTFYYDCVISTWYRGYTILNQDISVENFQSWLAPPMQEFGMCWR